MKVRFLFLLTLFFMTTGFAGEGKYSYMVLKNPYRFSTYFEMMGEHGYEGRVVSNFFHARTTYDLYNAAGVYEGQGICRALSLGVLCSWARDIDIYDATGVCIGLIQGQVLTTAAAKFNFYDAYGQLVCSAYQNYNQSSFNMLDASPMERMMGVVKRNAIADEWDVTLYQSDIVDHRCLKIFSAFVSDYQDSW